MVLRDACASKKYEKGTTKYGKSKQKVNDKCNKVGENNVVKKKYKESTKKYVKIQKSKENEQILMQRNLETMSTKSNDIKYELKYFQTKKQPAGFNALSKNIFPFKINSQKVYSLSKYTHPKL